MTTCATCQGCGERSALLYLEMDGSWHMKRWVCRDCALTTFEKVLHSEPVGLEITITVTPRPSEEGDE